MCRGRHLMITALVALAILALLPGLGFGIAGAQTGEDSEPSMLRAEPEQTVYVEARRLRSGNVQFRLQTSAGVRTPRLRTFRASVQHSRWLSSSLVELEDGTRVRVIARRSGSALVEFGVRVDRPRQDFYPRARFFARASTVNEWLRSSEVALPASEAVTPWPWEVVAEPPERIEGGHRDGLIVEGDTLGDPEAPVLIVEYGDPF